MSAGRRWPLLVLLALPGPALANSGVGLMMHTFPGLVVLLVPAIFIEAPILAARLRIPFGESLRLAARVNLYSTLIGLAIAFAMDFVLLGATGGSGAFPSRGTMLLALVPMFFITWWLEGRAVRRKLKRKDGVRSATFIANAASYAALFVAVLATPLFHFLDGFGAAGELRSDHRRFVHAREQVGRHYERLGRFPATFAEAGGDVVLPPRFKDATIEPDGRIAVRLVYPTVPELHGRRIVHIPVATGRAVSWRCEAPDLPDRYYRSIRDDCGERRPP